MLNGSRPATPANTLILKTSSEVLCYMIVICLLYQQKHRACTQLLHETSESIAAIHFNSTRSKYVSVLPYRTQPFLAYLN